MSSRTISVTRPAEYTRASPPPSPSDTIPQPAASTERLAPHREIELSLAEWREASRHLNGNAKRLIATIEQLEQTLEKFRRDLLGRSAEEYRSQPGALGTLTEGLARLRENAVQIARQDAREIVSRFGQMGERRLAAVG